MLLLGACAAVFFVWIQFFSHTPRVERLERFWSSLAKPLLSVSTWIRQGGERILSWPWGDKQLLSQLETLRLENRRLYGELVLLQERVAREDRAQNHALQLGLATGAGITASVVGRDTGGRFESLWVGVGKNRGVQVRDTVFAQGGLVGRVLKVHDSMAQVLLITDRQSVVDVLDLRTRAQGSLRGEKHKMSMGREGRLTYGEYFSAKQEVLSGDLLVTTGQDGLFPGGIPVGTVEAVLQDSTGLFQNAMVVPYVEMEKLEEVLILPFQSKGTEATGLKPLIKPE